MSQVFIVTRGTFSHVRQHMGVLVPEWMTFCLWHLSVSVCMHLLCGQVVLYLPVCYPIMVDKQCRIVMNQISLICQLNWFSLSFTTIFHSELNHQESSELRSVSLDKLKQ